MPETPYTPQEIRNQITDRIIENHARDLDAMDLQEMLLDMVDTLEAYTDSSISEPSENTYVDSIAFDIESGALTLGRAGDITENLSVDLDGRYLQSEDVEEFITRDEVDVKVEDLTRLLGSAAYADIDDFIVKPQSLTVNENIDQINFGSPKILEFQSDEIINLNSDARIYGDLQIDTIEEDSSGSIKILVESSGKVKYKTNDTLKDEICPEYIHIQASASAIWSINHGYNKVVDVTVYDVLGVEIEAKIDVSDLNTTVITFNTATAGKAKIT